MTSVDRTAVDPAYGDPRLARLYDPLDADRSDLDAYAAIVAELGGRSVLDVGCGTGTFACLLASRGLEVVGVDPAGASLAIATAKPGADDVRWVHGDATALPALQVDVATMTANVAQVFLTDEDWAATLRALHAALRPGGHLVFETRDPAVRAWEAWTPERTRGSAEVPGVGRVDDELELRSVDGDRVTVRWTVHLVDEGGTLASDTTLRFRSRAELDASLTAAGFSVVEVRDAPERPGREWVYLARRDG